MQPSQGQLLKWLALPFLVVVLASLALACSGDSGSDSDDGAASAGTCGPEGSAIAAIERSGQRRFSAPPAMVIDPAKSYTAVLDTVKGEITIELAAGEAPITVNNFVYLSCVGYYDGLTFHRYDPGFVVQGGDPRGDGSGGPGYIFEDEFSDTLSHNAAGVVSMANSGVNTNGSQFFITLAPALHLDGKHSVFGKVTSDMRIVRAIRPGDVIHSISIQESSPAAYSAH